MIERNMFILLAGAAALVLGAGKYRQSRGMGRWD